MPFGLHNAAQTFQHFIDQVLRGLTHSYAYIDNILIASTTKEDHKVHLRQVFTPLRKHGILINPSKCVLGAESLEFLGHHVDRHGIQPVEGKVTVIRQFPQPTTLRKLRQFLGLISFYHRFIPDCAKILQPLNVLLALPSKGEDKHLIWTEQAVSAFNQVKEALAKATFLFHSQPDAPTCLITDSSDVAVCTVLQQLIGAFWSPIAYFPRKLHPAETKYSTFDRELLAQITSVFRIDQFYHRFIPDCAKILQPLNVVLAVPSKGEDKHLIWTEQAVSAFNQVKEALAKATLLFHPQPDAPTCLITDSSDVAVCTVLQQLIGAFWSPIAYFPRKLHPAETKYSTFDRELQAIYLANKHFRHFLESRTFHVITDHKPLNFVFSTQTKQHSPRADTTPGLHFTVHQISGISKV